MKITGIPILISLIFSLIVAILIVKFALHLLLFALFNIILLSITTGSYELSENGGRYQWPSSLPPHRDFYDANDDITSDYSDNLRNAIGTEGDNDDYENGYNDEEFSNGTNDDRKGNNIERDYESNDQAEHSLVDGNEADDVAQEEDEEPDEREDRTNHYPEDSLINGNEAEDVAQEGDEEVDKREDKTKNYVEHSLVNGNEADDVAEEEHKEADDVAQEEHKEADDVAQEEDEEADETFRKRIEDFITKVKKEQREESLRDKQQNKS